MAPSWGLLLLLRSWHPLKRVARLRGLVRFDRFHHALLPPCMLVMKTLVHTFVASSPNASAASTAATALLLPAVSYLRRPRSTHVSVIAAALIPKDHLK